MKNQKNIIKIVISLLVIIIGSFYLISTNPYSSNIYAEYEDSVRITQTIINYVHFISSHIIIFVVGSCILIKIWISD